MWVCCIWLGISITFSPDKAEVPPLWRVHDTLADAMARLLLAGCGTSFSCETFLNYGANGPLEGIPCPFVEKALVSSLRKSVSEDRVPQQQHAGRGKILGAIGQE